MSPFSLNQQCFIEHEVLLRSLHCRYSGVSGGITLVQRYDSFVMASTGPIFRPHSPLSLVLQTVLTHTGNAFVFLLYPCQFDIDRLFHDWVTLCSTLEWLQRGPRGAGCISLMYKFL